MFWNVVVLILLAVSLLYLIAGCKALRRGKPVKSLFNSVLACVFLIVGLTLLFGTVGLRGYQAFNHEALVARVSLEPISEHKYIAHFVFADGQEKKFTLSGDEILVDAYVLKWKPLANMIGLHTSYQLARVSGRYSDYEDEVTQERTVFKLNETKAYDLFKARRKFSSLTYLVDAEYGSASFVPARQAQYALLISTSGLLFRELKS